MKNLIRFLVCIFALAALLAIANFVLKHPQNQEGDISREIASGDIPYKLETLNVPAQEVKAPVLPDISGYTAEAVEKKIPDLQKGEIAIQNLEDSYIKVRRLVMTFGDMQQRLDPAIIAIVEGVYDLETVYKTINDPSYLDKKADGTFVAYVPIIVKSTATFIIQNQKLLLSSSSGGLITSFGKLYIVNSDIRGWDTHKNIPATFKDDESFRPYVVGWCGSQMYLSGSHFGHLGYFDSKAYGITYTSCHDTVYDLNFGNLPGATGWVIDNIFDDIYYGFYSFESDDVVVLRNKYKDNIVYGIDPHDRSNRLIIGHNHIYGTKQKHGIIISREVNDSFLFHNLSENNQGSGMMIDRKSVNNVIAYNTLKNNTGDGLTFYESENNLSYANIMSSNQKSGMRVRNSWGITSRDDVINQNKGVGLQAYTDNLQESGHDKRNLNVDPYYERVEIDMAHAEMVGNREAQFKIENIDALKLSALKTFKNPPFFFAGDLKKLDIQHTRSLYDPDKSFLITHKNRRPIFHQGKNPIKKHELSTSTSDAFNEDDNEE
ncbi:MAG: right-handed parallel beta-helix repeat-containing protein [Alphaproteobacteria bacterium]|nr:right-handed parallel beta-helix repeat-containing protein [Alphaproteobacteria bacterium]